MRHSLRQAGYSLIAFTGLLLANTAQAININLDFTYDTTNFFSAPNSVSALQSAAAFFEMAISDDLLAINSGGFNSFDVQFFDPSTGGVETITDFSVGADTITIFVGARPLAGSTLAEAGPGGFNCSGIGAFCANAATRGEGSVADVQGATATEVAPWGGSIAFDSTASWYFDPDTSTNEAFSDSDFFSVAIHEIGHVLGIGLVDSWVNMVDAINEEYLGLNSVAAFGGNVPLNPDLDHWAEGTLSFVFGVSQEASMDPSIANGVRKLFTDLDVAALNDIGWEATMIPLPAALPLFAGALAGLAGLRRRRKPASA